MKVKWVDVYFPIGKWVDERGVEVKIPGNFRCKVNGATCFCVMVSEACGGGHGESRTTSKSPMCIREDTLEEVDIFDEYVEVW